MLRIVRHHFRAGFPLLALTGLGVGVYAVSSAIHDIASANVSSGFLGALGGGIDEFGVRVGTAAASLSAFSNGADRWLMAGAIAATAVSVMSAVRSLSEWIHGPTDVVGLMRHATQRAGGLVGTKATRVRWGTVYDEHTGEPIPFARVHVIDGLGSLVASGVSDLHGAFGFALSASDVFSRGGIEGLRAQKCGYGSFSRVYPVTAGSTVHSFDIPMKKVAPLNEAGPFKRSTPRRIAEGVAFWGGVLTVPMVYYAVPGIGGQLMVALFGVSAIVRAVRSGSRT